MKIVIMTIYTFFFVICGISSGTEKSLIGETAWVEVGNTPITFLARIDTGARTTSIHAVDISITNKSQAPEKNIGKKISFKTATRDDISKTIKAVITQVSTISNSQGTEQRYVIALPIAWHQIKKTVQVNLRDRTKMNYKLLIGRNWLSKDFLVDVDMQARQKGETQ